MIWEVLPRVKTDLIEQLLINRGITTRAEKELFFNPKLANFEKDLQIPGIDKAIKRINEAISKNELIVVFGDYDVDGVCASAVLYKALSSIGAKVLPYIPHRDKEGYGLSKFGLDYAKANKAVVVITVDNGIVAFEQAEYAKQLGLDLIITDHHVPAEKMPDAFGIVHSTKMCGAAVAWCLIREVVKKELANELLQLVAIATICDLMPLKNINRSFVIEGLKVLNTTTNLGLLSLISFCRISLGKIGSYEIGHIIGPRINAIGRLEHAIDALRLLCTKDPTKARSLAKLLCDTNEQRQKLTIQAIDEARIQVKTDKRIHILTSPEWSSGIIGLIAGRISEEYLQPAIAISVGEVISKGSARSANGVNIIEFIRECSEILIDVGGHPGAAGFSIHTDKIKLFQERLDELSIKIPEKGEQKLTIDAELKGEDLTKQLIKNIERLEPFGFGNSKPVFCSHNMKASSIRTVGNGKHLKFKCNNINAIAFGMGNLERSIREEEEIDVAYYLDIDDYDGNEKVQLLVKDIKTSGI